jgi:hypothetical protein
MVSKIHRLHSVGWEWIGKNVDTNGHGLLQIPLSFFWQCNCELSLRIMGQHTQIS